MRGKHRLSTYFRKHLPHVFNTKLKDFKTIINLNFSKFSLMENNAKTSAKLSTAQKNIS